MELLDHLRELQATLDNLGTIQRALGDFPPDLAALAHRLQDLQAQQGEARRQLEEARRQADLRTAELAKAQLEVDRARSGLKAANQKTLYAAALREVDEKERQRAAIQKPLKALEDQAARLEATLGTMAPEVAGAQAQFDELHAIFLEEHANQVEGRKLLEAKRAELEARLGSGETARFHKLVAARKGRAVVPVEGGACTGCHVKLRGPVLFQLKEAKTLLACESCQRILFLP